MISKCCGADVTNHKNSKGEINTCDKCGQDCEVVERPIISTGTTTSCSICGLVILGNPEDHECFKNKTSCEGCRWEEEFNSKFKCLNGNIYWKIGDEKDLNGLYIPVDHLDSMIVTIIKSFIRQIHQEDKKRLEEKWSKLWDKYQSELHGGYDDADALLQREIALDDIKQIINEIYQ